MKNGGNFQTISSIQTHFLYSYPILGIVAFNMPFLAGGQSAEAKASRANVEKDNTDEKLDRNNLIYSTIALSIHPFDSLV